jgi:hypothetical protein
VALIPDLFLKETKAGTENGKPNSEEVQLRECTTNYTDRAQRCKPAVRLSAFHALLVARCFNAIVNADALAE